MHYFDACEDDMCNSSSHPSLSPPPPPPCNLWPSRESQAVLENEKSLLQLRCLELEGALRNQQEEMGNRLAEQQQVSHSWRDRWEQATVTLKSKEEELAEAHRQSQAFSTKVSRETPLALPLSSLPAPSVLLPTARRM